MAGILRKDDPIYKNTRAFVLSKRIHIILKAPAQRNRNPHTDQYIWHIALTMQGLTSDDEEEKNC